MLDVIQKSHCQRKIVLDICAWKMTFQFHKRLFRAYLLGGITAHSSCDRDRFCLAKGFCRAKFLAQFALSRGAVRGEVFLRSSGRSFSRSFGEVLLGHSEQKRFSKNFSPKAPRLCAAKVAKTQGKTSAP